MALRGLRPTEAELGRSNDLQGLVDEWLESDAFGATIRDMHDETLLLRVNQGRPSIAWKEPLSRENGAGHESFINAQIQEAPLKLIEYIIRTDRPYTEILTADFALGNETMGVSVPVSPVTPVPCASYVRQATWRIILDGRDAVGRPMERMELVFCRPRTFLCVGEVLANQNRARANAITRAFLCYDFLDQPVALDESSVDLADVDAVANAVRDNPACAACHESLDPIASFLYGYQPARPGRISEYPAPMYDSRDAYQPGRRLRNLREPALFGRPGVTLADLGQLIVEHPDFAPCTVRRMYAYLSQTSVDDVPNALVERWAAEFVENGYNTKALLKRWFCQMSSRYPMPSLRRVRKI